MTVVAMSFRNVGRRWKGKRGTIRVTENRCVAGVLAIWQIWHICLQFFLRFFFFIEPTF
jgi:hypothetical protein